VSSRSFTLRLPCGELIVRERFEEGVSHDDQSLQGPRAALADVVGHGNQTCHRNVPAGDHDVITGVRTLNQA
jgi:hypothetical protein